MKLFVNKNLFFLFLGRLITNGGDSLYRVAIAWLIYSLTGSALYTGIAAAVSYIPEVIAFLIGPLVDRYNKKKIIIVAEVFQFALISIVAIMMFNKFDNIYLLLIIIFFAAFAVQFTYPAESAVIPTIVPKRSLPRANALMTFSYQGTDMIFSGLAGFLIVIWDISTIFVIDALTFLLAIMCFSFLSLKNTNETEPKATVKLSQSNIDSKFSINTYKQELLQGLKLIKNPVIFHSKMPAVISNFFFAAAFAVMPVYSDKVGGPEFFGLLLACYSIGSLIGSFLTSFFKNIPIGSILYPTYILSGLLWLASVIAASNELIILTLVLFSFSGIPQGIGNNASSLITQCIVPPQMLGRLSSAIGTLLTLGMPIGAFLGGILAEAQGPTIVMMLNGITISLMGIYYLISKPVREIPAVEKISPINTDIYLSDFENRSVEL